MTVLLDQFVETLSESGLMTAAEVQAFLDGLGADERPETSEELAKLLFRHGKLTKFQAQCIYQGKTKGLVLGNYVVLEKIGEGGMGYVYKARHQRMKREVALKVLPSHVTRSKGAVARFQREVEAAAQLNHPNIVTAHDADEADGVHFFVMECVDGEDLAQTVIRRGPLPVQEAIDYTIQAARGLEYAHNHGVVHRDIKPGNLLLDREGTVKVLDMGLARFEKDIGADDSTAAAPLTQSGQVMGTFDYMSPEQAEDSHHADHRADVYSLGCTLFYLLTGRPVYEGDTPMTKMLAHREQPVPSICAIRRGAPEALDAIFQRMVAKRPEDRQQSMGAVVSELEAVRSAGQHAQTETYSPSSGPTGGDDTHSTPAHAGARLAPDDSALEDWLHAELPATPTQLRTKPAKKLQLTKQQTLYGAVAAALCFAVLLVFAVVITLKTPEGTIVVRVSEPGAEVSVDGDKMTLKAPGEEPVEVEVAEGEHTLKVTKGGFQTYTETFKIKSGAREVFTVELVPLARGRAESGRPKADAATAEAAPPPDPAAWKALLSADAPAAAIAPFDAGTAKKHQQAWADYLGGPVEEDVELGDGVKLTMVLIPPGEFDMGSTEDELGRLLEEAKQENAPAWYIKWLSFEAPKHRVRITRPVGLGRHEVTRGQFRQFVDQTDHKTEAERDGKGGYGFVDGNWLQDSRFVWSADSGFPQTDDHPVVNVSWNDATAFCQWLSKKQGVDYDLPSEAQWEYACRAGTTTRYSFGDDCAALGEYAWWWGNSSGTTRPVCGKRPNAWGLFDMHGNVWEWCADAWAEDYYARSPTDDPAGPDSASRVLRGGSWNHDYPGPFRCAYRYLYDPDYRHANNGFRVARTLTP